MKSLFTLFILFLCLISGFFTSQTAHIETLKGWSFQYNKGTDDFSVFFGLLDEDGNSISSEVDVDIRIINENNEKVYQGTKTVSTNDFDYYTSKARGKEYLANVTIPASDVLPGTSSSGKVYLTVYKDDIVRFDEVNCDARYCLPIKDIQLRCDNLPLQLSLKDYFGKTESIIQIYDVSYRFEKEYLPELKITISGEKTYGNQNPSYDILYYKLYDGDGYMVDSGSLYLHGLSKGDKFKDDSLVINNITPGASYTLKLMEYSG